VCVHVRSTGVGSKYAANSAVCVCVCVRVCVTGVGSKYAANSANYGVATVSRIDKITGLFCRISSLL